jgi:hypothetical protein
MPIRFTSVLLLTLALVGLSGPPARAHTVTLKSGKVFEGKVISQNDREVVIETTFDGRKTLARVDVASVDTSVPPLRDQLQFRASKADTAEARWDLYDWAKRKGFENELTYILEAIVDLKPNDRRARKLLGHKKVGGKWMSPEQEQEHLKRKFEAEQRAKGLVPYKGGWVTPEERDAREKGLMKDGDDWVTEEEYHRRRGEKLVDGKWIKLGFKEGKTWSLRVTREARVNLRYEWSPHYNVVTEVKGSLAKRIIKAAEKAFEVMRDVLEPSAQEYPETIEERIHLILCNKLPAYVRFSEWFDKTYDADSLVPGWALAVRRQHSWWWVQDLRTTGLYQFPNTDKTFVSNVVHNVGLILLTRYRYNYTFPTVWLREGFAYHVEMEALGYSQSFTLGRGGGSGGAAAGAKGPIWIDSAKWRGALKKLVADGQDPPLRRIARMTQDQFRYVELVKAWSVVEFLIRWDRTKFKAFMDASKVRDAAEEDALRKAYGVGYRDLDRKWREYVSAGFKITP